MTTNCNKCGLPIGFARRPGRNNVLKWFPANPDGTEHWDVCKRTQRQKNPPAPKPMIRTGTLNIIDETDDSLPF